VQTSDYRNYEKLVKFTIFNICLLVILLMAVVHSFLLGMDMLYIHLTIIHYSVLLHLLLSIFSTVSLLFSTKYFCSLQTYSHGGVEDGR
jgi:hypothetical protein